MSYRVVFAPEADAQLLGIYRYIAGQASPETAARFASAIVDYCEGFQTFPERGMRREDLRPGLRIIGFRRSVTVAFTIEAAVVTILGVFYGGQDFEASLMPEV